MKFTRTLAPAAVVLVGLASTVALAPAADASGGLAPSCVKRHVGSTGGVPSSAQVRLVNRCGSAKTVKVVWTHARDTRCFRLAAGRSRTEHSPVALPFSHYDKTITC